MASMASINLERAASLRARATHAQSHDNDYAARRELQHAYYFTREAWASFTRTGIIRRKHLARAGVPSLAMRTRPSLGQWGDGRVPNLLFLHDQFARGYQRGVWSDGDFVAYERIDKRENGSMPDEDGVTMLFMMNDNYASGQARSFASSFPTGAYLYNYSWYGGGFYKFKEGANTVVVPAGGYFIFSWKNPDPSNAWQNAAAER